MNLLGPAPRLGQVYWPSAPVGPQATVTQGGGVQPAAPGTTVTVRVLDPLFKPVPGAKVTALAVPVHGSRAAVGSGLTNSKGEWIFTHAAVPTAAAYRYDFQVAPGGAPIMFPQAETTGIPGRVSVARVVVCPAGTDPLVCEVAEKQLAYQVAYDDELKRWPNPGFASRQAHAVLRNLPVRDSRLEPYFNEKSWGVADTGIPPQDWPMLVKYYAQAKRVLNNVPWPKYVGAAEKVGVYFRRCAMGIPVGVGFSGAQLSALSFRLYAPTHAAFFPKSDKQLRQAFALAWTANMYAIWRCVNHRIKKKARETAGSMRMHSLAGLVAAGILGPIAGPGGYATIVVSELVDHYQIVKAAQVSEDVAQALPEITGVLTQPGLTTEMAVAGLLTVVLNIYLTNADISPTTKAVIKNGLPLIVDQAVSDLTTGVIEGATATEVLTAPQAASAVTAALVKLLASTIRAEGIKGAKEFGRMVLGYQQQSEAAMIPFQLWLFKTLELGTLFKAAATEAGLDFDPERDLYGVAVEEAAKGGVTVPVAAKAPGAADTPGPGSRVENIAAAGAGVLILGVAAATLFGGS